MCGIAGEVTWGGQQPSDLHPALRALAHRGPDSEDLWRDEHCTLVHRRLAVIDTSPAGDQPMSTSDGALIVTFSGEIYNFHALRRELAGRGNNFATGTDTEVLLVAYRTWGPACLERFQGMFAFAIWEPSRKILFLARDRLGKKPLFHARVGKSFRFASSLQALMADGRVPRRADLSSIDRYLSWGYVPAPWSGYEGVQKLVPAHWMTVDLAGHEPVIHSERWWALSYEPKLDVTERDAQAMLRERLTESVRLRMISDVPVGAFLSGGVDSSIVVGLMAEQSSKPVQTFSLGSAEAGFNELAHARRVAERFGTDHHEIVLGPEAADIIPHLVRHFGEPFADSSAIPTFFVSQMSRRNVTVALTGDGGDEVFGGYERHRANRLAERLRHLSGAELAAGPPGAQGNPSRVQEQAATPMAERYARWIAHFDDGGKRALYGPELRPFLGRGRAASWIAGLLTDSDACHPLDKAMAVDAGSYLPYDLLAKVDVASMANGLEARSPFLDHQVMELAARFPASFKVRGARSKHVLLESCIDLLPRENYERPKMGFGIPIGEWFRGSLRGMLSDALLSKEALCRGYFEPSVVGTLLQDHLDRRVDNTHRLWALFVLELWHRELVDG